MTDGRRRIKTRPQCTQQHSLRTQEEWNPEAVAGWRARRWCSPDAARWSRRPAERATGPSAWASPQGPGAGGAQLLPEREPGGAPHHPKPQRLGMQRASCFPGLGAGSRSAATALEGNTDLRLLRGLRIMHQVRRCFPVTFTW